jgi:hypothetical protein
MLTQRQRVEFKGLNLTRQSGWQDSLPMRAASFARGRGGRWSDGMDPVLCALSVIFGIKTNRRNGFTVGSHSRGWVARHIAIARDGGTVLSENLVVQRRRRGSGVVEIGRDYGSGGVTGGRVGYDLRSCRHDLHG